MKLAELQYELPSELIAQSPAAPRDASRLLVLDRESGRIEHRVFREIGEFLRPGDCLVLNDTRVIPARFFCRRTSGGKIEALFLNQQAGLWRVLLKPSGRLKVGERLGCGGGWERGNVGTWERENASESTRPSSIRIPSIRPSDPPGGTDKPAVGSPDILNKLSAGLSVSPDAQSIELILRERLERGEWAVEPMPVVEPFAFLKHHGQTPLPPYIRRASEDVAGNAAATDAERYQTVYARQPGAVAAPTAGLHFTPELLARLEQNGVRRIRVTLHVGHGTFAPIEVEDLARHKMHAEWFEAGEDALHAIHAARAAGGRVVAVGTTAARVLETLAARPHAPRGWTDIFLYPPYRFRNVDALLTNFHLPGSTLLALVMACAGVERVRAAYREAVAQRYRFYSYGDAMLIL